MAAVGPLITSDSRLGPGRRPASAVSHRGAITLPLRIASSVLQRLCFFFSGLVHRRRCHRSSLVQSAAGDSGLMLLGLGQGGLEFFQRFVDQRPFNIEWRRNPNDRLTTAQ